MSEKNHGDESPLRPVESADGPDANAEGPDWMDALGVGWTSNEEPASSSPETETASEESDESSSDEGWMAQLGGSEPPADRESPVDDPAGMEPAPPADGKRRRDWVLPAAMVGVLVVLVGGAGLVLASQLSGGGDEATDITADLAEIEGKSDAAPASAATTPTGQASAFECSESKSSGTVTGSGEGDTESVAGVVLAFEHAYYDERDAEEALSLTSDDSALVNEEALQKGIDSVPSDTEHCVSITADGDTARVELTEARPSAAPETFVQTITTSRDGDRVEIVDITAEGD